MCYQSIKNRDLGNNFANLVWLTHPVKQILPPFAFKHSFPFYWWLSSVLDQEYFLTKSGLEHLLVALFLGFFQ
jgi:hypothetical protein